MVTERMKVQEQKFYGAYSGVLPDADLYSDNRYDQNRYGRNRYARTTGVFEGSLERAQRSGETAKGAAESDTETARSEQEDWEEKLRRWDEQQEQMRQQRKREQKLREEERIRRRRIQRKLWEKLAYKKYLARQDEIEQMNEKIALERMVGEDVYIWKAPLSKTLTLAEIRAICSEA